MGTDDKTGTYNWNIAKAYKKFFSYCGYSCTATRTIGTLNGYSVIDQLKNNRPIHLILLRHPKYGNHSVLALGYKQYTYKDSLGIPTHVYNYIRIFDGWSSTCNRFVFAGNGTGVWQYVRVIPST